MQKFPRIWDTQTRVSYLQRKILISSILYYESTVESPLSDKEYDELCKQLVELQKVGLKGSQYEYVFYDFDGTTGFDLRSRLTIKDNKYLTHLAYLFTGHNMLQLKKDKPKPKKGRLI